MSAPYGVAVVSQQAFDFTQSDLTSHVEVPCALAVRVGVGDGVVIKGGCLLPAGVGADDVALGGVQEAFPETERPGGADAPVAVFFAGENFCRAPLFF